MLRERIQSAFVMAPVALAAAWFGGLAFALLVAVAGFAMLWEWQRLTTPHRGFDGLGRALAGAMVATAMLTVSNPAMAGLVVLVAAVYALVAGRSPWLAAGAVYIGVPLLSLVWLREAGGTETLLWLFAVVWGTDIGAYAAGRLIGGPKIAPLISPSKTWAGLLGGMAAAAGLSAYGAGLVANAHVVELAAAGAGLAVVAQGGDFFESWLKRRAGVKDSSGLIPGHGGVLDRVDGLIAVAPLVALWVVLHKGGVATW